MLTEKFLPDLGCNYAFGPANGPPLVLLHGVLRNGRDFQPLMPSLMPFYEVIALDFRGHGASVRADSYYVRDYVDDAVKLVIALKRPAFVYGHSLGGMVAAGVAARVPELVRGIILEDPPFHTMGERLHTTPLHRYFTEVAEVARRGGTVAEITARLGDTCFGDGRRLGEVRDAVAIRFAAACLSSVDPAVLTPIVNGEWLTGYDVDATLGAVKCPTLLLQGDPSAGGMLTDADVSRAETRIADCTTIRFTGAGHLLHWARTQDVANHTLAFLMSHL